MSPFVRQNASLLRFLALQPEGGATIAAIAEHFGRDRENTRKTIKKLGGEGVVGWSSTSAALTDAGRAALAELDMDAPPAGEIAPAGERIARVPVDKLERSPLNAREDMGDLDGLAAVFIHEGDCPAPLEVGPLNENGKHFIHAGERRWRAAMLALDQGLGGIVADQGLPCIVKARTRGEILYTVVVENSQRKNLTALEDARGLLALQEETGLSARALAFATGRAKEGSETGVADVQQKIKIAKEATPEAVAAYLADGNWDALRDSVQTKKPAPSGPYVLNGVDYLNDTRFEEAKRLASGERAGGGSPAQRREGGELPIERPPFAPPDPEGAVLQLPEERLLVEIAHKTASQPLDAVSGLAKVGEYWTDLRATRLQGLRLISFRHAGIPMVGVTQGGAAWLLAHGYSLPIDRDQLNAAYERTMQPGYGHEGYATEWLNTDAPPSSAVENPTLAPEADHQVDLEDAVDDAQLAQDRDALARVTALREAFADSRLLFDADMLAALQAIGLQGPFKPAEGAAAGGLLDANGEEFATVDMNREHSDERAQAIAGLLALALQYMLDDFHLSEVEPTGTPAYLRRLAGA